MKELLKTLAERAPYPVGKILARVPFPYRLGKEYTRFSDLLSKELSDEELEQYIVAHFSSVFDHAKRHFPFYRELYSSAGLLDLTIECVDDIKRVPIITKSMIRDHTDQFNGALRLNTGGSSGTPFSFFVDKDAFAREWAHMHFIWAKKKYSYRDPKLTFRGRNLAQADYIYNPVHNEFIVNTYRDPGLYIHELTQLVDEQNIRFVHGYPSAIYNFLKETEQLLSEQQLQQLRDNLTTCLLGSEFPIPYMKDYFVDVWGLECLSWYGHSEMAILAHDVSCENNYRCLHSYGYAEIADSSRLIGTSYHNRDMPLIRYDTGDRVSGLSNSKGILQSFSVTEGREGDFVVDKHGKNVPLTALIFGRHHKIFESADTVQVAQGPNRVVTLIVTSRTIVDDREALAMFDLSNVAVDFRVALRARPVITNNGKMLLKVPWDLFHG